MVFFFSGLGYVYPATWHEAKFNAFARMTGEYLSETFLALGNNSQKRGPLNIIGAGNLVSPNMSALQALLQQDSVEGLFWYTFSAGYSGWNGTIFDRKSKNLLSVVVYPCGATHLAGQCSAYTQ